MKDTRKKDWLALDVMVGKYGILEVLRTLASVAKTTGKMAESSETGIEDGDDEKLYQGYTASEWEGIERLIERVADDIESDIDKSESVRVRLGLSRRREAILKITAALKEMVEER
jgi:hypothetical protein